MSITQNRDDAVVDLDLAESIVRQAIAQGADEAEVLLTQGADFRVVVRKGVVERLTESQPHALSLRVYKNKRGAVTYTSDLNRDGLSKLVNDALDLADISDPDPYAGLPDPADLASNFATNLNLYDPTVGDLPPDMRIELAKRAEEAAFADPRITNSNSASFGTNLYAVGLVNSLGFAGSYKGSYCSLSMAALAEGEDGKMQTDGWGSRDHFFKNLEKAEDIGKKAAERTIRQLGARKVPTKRVPIVWEKEVAAEFIGELSAAVSGVALYRRNSFLLDWEGQPIGSDLLTIVDDPLRPGLMGSRPFDGEGIASRRNAVFTKGVFDQFLFNTYAARKTNRRTTGSAAAGIGSFPKVGVSNFYLEAGQTSFEEIVGGVQDGLYLTGLMGFGVNYVTGDLSQGAVGLWIENGQISYPVSEINISGNIKDMLKNLVQVGNDLEFRSSIAAPTIRIDGMMVSGL